MIDLLVIADTERRARLNRAKLRALEQRVGEATDDDGAYWLARTRTLEALAVAARGLLRGDGCAAEVRCLLGTLDDIQAPICRLGDHQTAA